MQHSTTLAQADHASRTDPTISRYDGRRALESKRARRKALRLVVLRRPIEEGKSLRQLVRANVAGYEKQSGFTILEVIASTVAELPAIVLRAHWRERGSVHYRVEANLAVDGTWMHFAVTGPFAERAACEKAFERTVQNLTWHTH